MCVSVAHHENTEQTGRQRETLIIVFFFFFFSRTMEPLNEQSDSATAASVSVQTLKVQCAESGGGQRRPQTRPLRPPRQLRG